MTPHQVLGWADAHHARTGGWPHARSGPIPEAPGETWAKVHNALRVGRRGLAGGTSLARLLQAERGARHQKDLPRLSRTMVLKWADQHFNRTGRWPTLSSGPIPDAPGETWLAVDAALRRGRRGVKRGSSLARFLAKHRAARNHLALAPLTVEQVLAWADSHRARTGRWPKGRDGLIADAPGHEKWSAVNAALIVGVRGFPGGDSLARLLERHRGAPAVRRRG